MCCLLCIKILEWYEVGTLVKREVNLDDVNLSQYMISQLNKAEYNFKSTATIIFVVFLILHLLFEYFVNPFSVWYKANAMVYLIYEIVVSVIVLVLTSISFFRLIHIIKSFRPDVYDNIKQELYNQMLGLFVVNTCYIATSAIFLQNQKSS